MALHLIPDTPNLTEMTYLHLIVKSDEFVTAVGLFRDTLTRYSRSPCVDCRFPAVRVCRPGNERRRELSSRRRSGRLSAVRA